MSTPGYPPYAAPPPPPRRRRPSGWWFVLAVGLMLAGVAIGVVVLVLTIRSFTETDATIAADGRPHQVSVGDSERMVWVDDDEPADCTIVDTRTGKEVRYTGTPDAGYTKGTGDREWEGDRTFDPGSGDLEVTCSADGGPIQIGPAPEFREFFGGIALGIFLPFFIGGIGFLLLILIAILFATGRPRHEP